MKEFLEKISFAQTLLAGAFVNAILFSSYPAALVLLAIAGLNCYQLWIETVESEMQDVNMVMLQNQIDEIRTAHESIHKVAAEAKKMLSDANIVKAFMPKGQRPS